MGDNKELLCFTPAAGGSDAIAVNRHVLEENE
jgi:hypothetical protein